MEHNLKIVNHCIVTYMTLNINYTAIKIFLNFKNVLLLSKISFSLIHYLTSLYIASAFPKNEVH